MPSTPQHHQPTRTTPANRSTTTPPVTSHQARPTRPPHTPPQPERPHRSCSRRGPRPTPPPPITNPARLKTIRAWFTTKVTTPTHTAFVTQWWAPTLFCAAGLATLIGAALLATQPGTPPPLNPPTTTVDATTSATTTGPVRIDPATAKALVEKAATVAVARETAWHTGGTSYCRYDAQPALCASWQHRQPRLPRELVEQPRAVAAHFATTLDGGFVVAVGIDATPQSGPVLHRVVLVINERVHATATLTHPVDPTTYLDLFPTHQWANATPTPPTTTSTTTGSPTTAPTTPPPTTLPPSTVPPTAPTPSTSSEPPPTAELAHHPQGLPPVSTYNRGEAAQ